METEKYNGWTNRQTWRVYLELVRGDEYNDYDETFKSVEVLAEKIKQYSENLLYNKSQSNFIDYIVYDYLKYVNWVEIAEAVVSNYPELIKE